MSDKKIKILIIDDDSYTREMYKEVFSNENFEVVTAKDGVEGLDKATKENPDVIFTGIMMPRMDGFAMIDALKKNISTCNMPIVISSHLGREVDRQRANTMGVKDFIVRDVTTPREVVERVKAIFAGGDYRIDINAMGMDAPKLAQSLGLNSHFQCLECGEKLVLLMKLGARSGKKYEASFICPHCGWESK